MQMLKVPITQGKLDELLASAKAIHDQNPRANFSMNLEYAELVQMLTCTTMVISDSLLEVVRKMLDSDCRITAIRVVRKEFNLSFLAANRLVENWPERPVQ